jgi:hypothetical protein
VALANLVMSLALTPWLGLEGVVIGTAVPYLAAFPFLIRVVLEEVPAGLTRLVRESFLPALSLGAALAACLAAARLVGDPDSLPILLALITGSVVAYWVVFYLAWLSPPERRLVHDVARGFVPRQRAR